MHSFNSLKKFSSHIFGNVSFSCLVFSFLLEREFSKLLKTFLIIFFFGPSVLGLYFFLQCFFSLQVSFLLLVRVESFVVPCTLGSFSGYVGKGFCAELFGKASNYCLISTRALHSCY